MHGRKRNNILQPLELSRNERTRRLRTLMSTNHFPLPCRMCWFVTHPRTSVAHKQVIAALLRRELGAGLTRDPVAERALLALELARGVAGLDPVGDLSGGGGGGVGGLEVAGLLVVTEWDGMKWCLGGAKRTMVARYLTLGGVGAGACVWPGSSWARRHDETDLVAWSDGFWQTSGERCLSSG